MLVPWRQGWSPAGSLLGPGEAASSTFGLATPQRYPAHTPAYPAAPTCQQPEGLSQRQSHPRAPSPAHRGRGTVQPSARDWSGWVVATERPEEGECSSPGPMGPWGDGHPSATEHLPGFRSEHGLPHRQGPCQCEQMSSGKSLQATPQASYGQGNSTPHAAWPGPCPHEAHPQPPPVLGPLQLIPDPKGTWVLPKAQKTDVCVFRALESTPGPTLTPHTMGQEEEVGFWMGLGSS